MQSRQLYLPPFLLQRELWLQNRKMWTKFFKVIDWVQGENNVYRCGEGACRSLAPGCIASCARLPGAMRVP